MYEAHSCTSPAEAEEAARGIEDTVVVTGSKGCYILPTCLSLEPPRGKARRRSSPLSLKLMRVKGRQNGLFLYLSSESASTG